MKFISILLVCFLSVDSFAQSRQSVALKVAGAIDARSIGSTTPSLNFTVPSGQWCETTLTIWGLASSGTSVNTAQLVLGGTIRLLLTGGINGVSPYPIYAVHTMKLRAGTYTFNMYAGTWSAGAGSLIAEGICFNE